MIPLTLADVRRILPALELHPALPDHDLDFDVARRLKAKGVNPDGFSLQAAETLLTQLKERQKHKLCTLKQAAALEKFGVQNPASILFSDVDNRIRLAKEQTDTSNPIFLENLLANPPTAGNGVHVWLFSVARQLHARMGMLQMETLLVEKVQGCGRHVPIREIREAIKNSAACAWTPGEMPEAQYGKPQQKDEPSIDDIDLIVRRGWGLVDLWEASKIRFDDPQVSHTEYIIDNIFPGDPLLCCGKSSFDFHTRTRESWRGQLSLLQFIVPNPMKSVLGLTKDGRQSEHTLSAIGERIWQVLEFDFSKFAPDGITPTPWKPLIESWETLDITIADVCAALLLELAAYAPLVLVVSSGGKSLHGWFRIKGSIPAELEKFNRGALRLGACSSTIKNPSQFVRMPDGLRKNGKRQLVWYFNPELSK